MSAKSEAEAETMRRAAALMRTRANESIASPWHGPDPFGVIRAAYGSPDDGLPVHGEDCGCGGGIGHEPTAEHIASWHPAVALAVATWLDAAALVMEVAPDRHRGMALAVARAYLGEES